MRHITCAFAAALLAATLSLSQAAVLNVPGSYGTIQAAIDAASSTGDEIVVAPGTYVENLNMSGKNVRLRSSSPTDGPTRATTIIDGNSSGSVVTCAGTETSECIVEGFTIRNGKALTGGGIEGAASSATVRFCSIVFNAAVGDYAAGGAMANIYGLVHDNLISSNTASSRGAGIANCDGLVHNNVIEYNSVVPDSYESQDIGGGVDCCRTVRSNIIRYNQAHYGGGVAFCFYVLDNLIYDNSASLGGGVAEVFHFLGGNTIANNTAGFAGGYLNVGRSCWVFNNIIWGNGTPGSQQTTLPRQPQYCCIQNWTGGGNGTISSDPLFVAPANGNFQLQAGSPCIDAGMVWYTWAPPLNALGRKCRLSGSNMDIGVDEFGATLDTDGDLLPDTGEAAVSCNPLLPDTDGDGLEDGIELLRGTSSSSPNSPAGFTVSPGQLVQRGLFLAFPFETVTMQPGTYVENVFCLSKQFTLSSTDPLSAPVVASTILDGAGRQNTLFHSSHFGTSVHIDGLTIQNGNGVEGGGVLANNVVHLDRCVLRNNVATTYGGGGSLMNCSASNTVFEDNGAANGAGSYFGFIDSCVIRNNAATAAGGACYLSNATDSILTGNTAANGAAAYASDVVHCVAYGNTASIQGGGCDNCAMVRNSIVWNNSAPVGPQVNNSTDVAFSCIQNWAAGGTGNIVDDPQFVYPAGARFDLKVTSPCLDAGGALPYADEKDFLGFLRMVDLPGISGRGDNSGYDMGAYEKQSISAMAGDWQLFD